MAAMALAVAPALAIPPPQPEAGKSPAAVEATTSSTAPTLPFGSPIFFVLDDSFGSNKSQTGQIVHMHLKDALIVNGVTLAAAGAPATLTVVNVHKAAAGNNDGSIQISINPLQLANAGTLPVRANHEFLTIERTSGQQSTRAATDTVTDVLVPGANLYNALRKGREYVLPPGAELRALTGATIDASNPNYVAILAPPPLVTNYDVPHTDYTATPVFTPLPPPPRRTPAPKPTPVPTVTPAPLGTIVPEPTGTP
ncbi:MAG: hypothetical protein GIW95_06885 [Candidatus Eremiobacteraeota bacterium]|nr:hypothetical protein [Candidatus Eremiobacteraeota bacterium]